MNAENRQTRGKKGDKSRKADQAATINEKEARREQDTTSQA
jgi:hypothetical protein